MNELAINVEYLLLSRNYVIVPSLGIFRTTNVPARWIENENLFIPPVRSVHFDFSVISDPEEVFIQFISEIYGLSAKEALSRCEEMVADFHKALITEGNVDFGSIGVFTLEDDAVISMASCECGVITPNLYGLDVLHLPPLEDVVSSSNTQVATETIENISTSRSEELPKQTNASQTILSQGQSEHITFKVNRNVFNYAMALVASVLLFFILRPTNTLNGKHEYSNQTANIPVFLQPNMVNESNTIAYYSVDEENTVNMNGEYDAVLIDVTEEVENEGLDITSDAFLTDKQERKTTVTTEDTPSTSNVYVVVLASAVAKSNAQSFAEKLSNQGVKARIVEGKVRRIIVDLNFPTNAEAHKYMDKLNTENNNEFSNAWVLKM